jgi:hypothetical protein
LNLKPKRRIKMPDFRIEFFDDKGITVAVGTYSEKEFDQILEELCLLEDAKLQQAA